MSKDTSINSFHGIKRSHPAHKSAPKDAVEWKCDGKEVRKIHNKKCRNYRKAQMFKELDE